MHSRSVPIPDLSVCSNVRDCNKIYSITRRRAPVRLLYLRVADEVAALPGSSAWCQRTAATVASATLLGCTKDVAIVAKEVSARFAQPSELLVPLLEVVWRKVIPAADKISDKTG